MKVNDNNLSSLGSSNVAQTNRTQEAERNLQARAGASNPVTGDDVHLSELVRSLRSLAAESPERQARIEQIARAYASGNYQMDPQATASKIVDDALEP